MGILKNMKATGVIAAALAELQKEKVKDATVKLKTLYRERDQARKILRNTEREIEDYLSELEIDEGDTNESTDA